MIQRISLQFLEFLTKFLTTLLSVVAIVVASQPAFSQSYDNLSSPSITCKTGDYQTECPYVDTNSVSQTADTQTKSLAIPNRLLENDFNMFVNPGQLVNYGTAYLEGWGGSNNVWGGATIPLPNNQKLGVFLRRPTNALSPVGSIRTLFNQYTFDGTSPSRKTNTTSNQGDFTGETFGVLNNTVKSFGNIDLLYALPLGNMNLGFRLGYGHTAASSDNDTTKIETSTRTDDISFGAGSQIKNIAGGYIDLTLNLGTTISSYHYKDKTVGSKEAVDVTTGFPVSIGFLGRFVKPDAI